MKYEYHLRTWGGFYNEEYKAVHKKEEGDFWFNTKEEREKYLANLTEISASLNANFLMSVEHEGYHVRTEVVLNRISKHNEKEIHTTRSMGYGYNYDNAKYFLEYKWYPGFNDYPFGEDFDYSDPNFQVVQEWITGAFCPDFED